MLLVIYYLFYVQLVKNFGYFTFWGVKQLLISQLYHAKWVYLRHVYTSNISLAF